MTLRVLLPVDERRQRGAFVRELPHELYIETTNRCNLKCRTCPQYFGMPEDFADLTPDARRPNPRSVPIRPARRPARHRRTAAQQGPAADHRRREASRRARAVQHERPPAARPGSSSRSSAPASTNCASPSTRRRPRPTSSCAARTASTRIIENLRGAVAAEGVAAARSTPKISLWITGMKSNVEELPALVRLAREIGVREVYLQRLVYSGRGLAVQDEALFRQAADRRSSPPCERRSDLATELGIELKGSGEASAAEMVAGESARTPSRTARAAGRGRSCTSPRTATCCPAASRRSRARTTTAWCWETSSRSPQRRYGTDSDISSGGGRCSPDEPPEACAGCGAGWSL